MGRPLIDIAGQRFGRLTAVEHIHKGNKWKCRCDCGNETTVAGYQLRKLYVKSCGCLNSELSAKRTYRHGYYGAPEYISWTHAKARCNNPKNAKYPLYGGRGITMCKEWQNSFEEFLKHIGPKNCPSDTLDRIDTNGNYEPGNVRWASALVQANNHQRHRFVTVRGKRKTIADAARDAGLKYATVYTRIVREGWSHERAATTPVLAR